MKGKFKIGILILCTFYLNISYAQDFWEELYFPDSTNIRCITTNNEGHIFMGVGNNGNPGGVYRSVDTAQSWELVLDAGNFMVQSIAINEDGKIYIGKTGFVVLMVSETNGETWEEINLPSTNNVMKILCVRQDTVYVSTWEDNGALLLRSTDSGVTWDSIFTTTNHTSEYISDIAISGTGDIYISLMCYFENMGGVYKSEDGGDNWEYVGLINHQVWSLEFNTHDDLFIGIWSDFVFFRGGLYVLYSESDEIEELLFGPSVTDLVINCDDHIYFADVPGGVIRSMNDGQTFEYINNGLVCKGILAIDNNGYLYSAALYGGNCLNKSINSTITSIDKNKFMDLHHSIKLFPNPVNTILNVSIISELNNKTYYKVCIYDLFGKLILKHEKAGSGDCFRLDVSSLDKGFYLIKIHQYNKIYSSSFIKK